MQLYPRDGPYLCVFKREAGQEAYYTVVEAPEAEGPSFNGFFEFGCYLLWHSAS